LDRISVSSSPAASLDCALNGIKAADAADGRGACEPAWKDAQCERFFNLQSMCLCLVAGQVPRDLACDNYSLIINQAAGSCTSCSR
jgi:hypothetical protein